METGAASRSESNALADAGTILPIQGAHLDGGLEIMPGGTVGEGIGGGKANFTGSQVVIIANQCTAIVIGKAIAVDGGGDVQGAVGDVDLVRFPGESRVGVDDLEPDQVHAAARGEAFIGQAEIDGLGG